VAAVLSGNYQAVFMDCQMPGTDGLEATRRLRAAGVRLPIIAMTAGAFEEDRQLCRDAGMDDLLPKPWKPQELAGVLERLTATADQQEWCGRRHTARSGR
jgi:CheY-like chemotaxis protein